MDSLGSSRFDWKWRCLREWSQKPSSSSSSSSARLGCFVLLVEDLHQVLGHEVWFLWTAVITLQVLHWTTKHTVKHTQHLKQYIHYMWHYMCVILTETQEECVHTHVIHTEESMSDQIRTEHHRLSHTHTHFIKLNICHCLIQLYISFQPLQLYS